MTQGEATVNFTVSGVGTLTNASPLLLETTFNPTIYPSGAMAMTWDLTVGDTMDATLYLYFQAAPGGTTLVEAGSPNFLMGYGDLALSVAPMVNLEVSGTIGGDDYLQVFDTYDSGPSYPGPQPPCTVTTTWTPTGGLSGTVTCSATLNTLRHGARAYTATATFWAEPSGGVQPGVPPGGSG
jgi:hypothetical protein